jgi:hypothetical protein
MTTVIVTAVVGGVVGSQSGGGGKIFEIKTMIFVTKRSMSLAMIWSLCRAYKTPRLRPG